MRKKRMLGFESMADKICKVNLDSADLLTDLIADAHVFPSDAHSAVLAARLASLLDLEWRRLDSGYHFVSRRTMLTTTTSWTNKVRAHRIQSSSYTEQVVMAEQEELIHKLRDEHLDAWTQALWVSPLVLMLSAIL